MSAASCCCRQHPGPEPMDLDDYAAQDWLGSYREFAVLEQVIAGMQRRLSRPQLLDGSLAELERLYEPLSEDFSAFYPELMAFAEAELNASR